MEYYSVMIKKENLAFVTVEDGPGGRYANKITRMEENKYCLSLMWNLERQTVRNRE